MTKKFKTDKATGKKVDYIHLETTSDSLEIHRRINGYKYQGQKGKILVWTLPVFCKKNADEILEKIYNCKEWEKYGKGTETSKKSKELVDKIWQVVFPHIAVKSVRKAFSVVENETNEQFKQKSRKAMNQAQNSKKYIDRNRTNALETIRSNECYTFYQSVEMVANWFCKNVDENYFKDKVVYCNCDDTKSAFWMYFYNNFKALGLKKLIASSYDRTGLLYGDNYEEHERNIFSYNNNDEYKGYIYIYRPRRYKTNTTRR